MGLPYSFRSVKFDHAGIASSMAHIRRHVQTAIACNFLENNLLARSLGEGHAMVPVLAARHA